MKKTLLYCLSALLLFGSAPGFAQTKKSTRSDAPSSSTATNPDAQFENKTTIIKLGTYNVPVGEFRYVYNKNNSNADDAYTDKSVREYLDLYIKFKLKVIDAFEAGLDTTNAFKSELEGYRKQLAKPYLTEKNVTEQLVREAYERMKEEVNASHILITVDAGADPKDTMAAYTKIVDIRKKILAGANFETLAKENSQDPSAKLNGGNLGYFSAMQMVYPFEDAAYKTSKGSISQPVRTRFGYHIIKVLGRRAAQGTATVAHIMVKYNTGLSEEDSLAAKSKIDEIYSKLNKGSDFATLCAEFSDDQGSKANGGQLQPFSTGMMIPSFEEASFALAKPDDYSKPFLTPYGWHIVKLVEKKPLESFESMKAGLEQKVSKDSRADLNKAALIARLKKENGLSENASNLKLALAKADTNLLTGKWTFKEEKFLNNALVTIKSRKFTVKDFFNYVKSNQQTSKSKVPQFVMNSHYKEFVDKCVVDYEESVLEDKKLDYRMLVKEYREGILLFTLMDTKVWTKAMEDTSGLREFHAKNKEKYRWNQRANVVIYSASNPIVLEKVKASLAAKTWESADLKLDVVLYEKNAVKPVDKSLGAIRMAADILKRDKTLNITITGSAAVDEKVKVAKQRAQAMADSLVARGVERIRIAVRDGGKSTGKEDSDRKVTPKLFGTTPKSLERALNSESALSLQVTEGLFQREDNKTLDLVPDWKPGEYTVKNNDRENLIVISGLEQPRLRTFEEAKGLVISDYQNHLEEIWVDNLKKKHPVTVMEDEVKKIVKK